MDNLTSRWILVALVALCASGCLAERASTAELKAAAAAAKAADATLGVGLPGDGTAADGLAGDSLEDSTTNDDSVQLAGDETASDVAILADAEPPPADAAPDGIADAGSDAVDGGAGADADTGPPCTAGTPCNDGDPCTVTDTCTDGVCAGKPKACFKLADACHAASCGPGGECVVVALGTCEDGNPCTDDGCDDKAGCTHADNSAVCSDGNACTAGDACKAGKCAGGLNNCGCATDGDCAGKEDGDLCNGALYCDKSAPPHTCKVNPASVKSCDASKDGPCEKTQCAPASGLCVKAIANTGKVCDADGSVCTVGDACKGGVCLPGTVTSCDDGNGCTSDACNPATGCAHAPVAAGTTCGASMQCDAAGKCTNLNAVGCGKDGDACGGGKGKCSSGHCFWTDAKGYKWTLVPAGTFWMGCNATVDSECQPNESPQHLVELSAYWIGVYEVTNANYKTCMDGSGAGCTAPGSGGGYDTWGMAGKEQHPVNKLNWAQSQSYCKWLGGDLPSEAQWEKAAKGGCELYAGKDCKATEPKYPWGNGAPWCGQNAVYAVLGNTCGGTYSTYAVGTGSASGQCPYGAYDMAGNVWEWNLDFYDSAFYGNAAATLKDAVNSTSAAVRVSRGGSFSGSASYLRAAFRPDASATGADYSFGARCVRSVDLCAGVSCPDLPCATQVCSPANGACVATAKADGAGCSACNVGGVCQAGACKGGTALVCDDKLACTVDGCDVKLGCVFTPQVSKCEDGKPCTVNSCDQTIGCQFVNSTDSCSDGSVCTIGDNCSAGACVPGKTKLACDDGDPCTPDSCDASKGCLHGACVACGANALATCKGKCGGQGTGSCWCDAACASVGDCCPDKNSCGCSP